MLLQVKDLHAYYGASHVLQGISLNLRQGDIVALLGRNGMGKSTTLKTIIGLTQPKTGSIVFNGNEIAGLPPYKVANAGIGYVPEERRIFPQLNVKENLLMGVKADSRATSSDDSWTMNRVFSYFPTLKTRLNNKGAHLSGGEQQMLAIGRALMGNPLLLLVDEPTEGLAPIIVEVVRDVLAQINEAGVSTLLVEHNLKVATALAHRIYLMGKAHIGFEGTVQELDSRPDMRNKYLEV